MMKRTTSNAAVIALAVVTLGAGCGPDQRIIESGKRNDTEREAAIPNSNAAPAASTFEQDLDAMRTADFKFIVVIRRKDGQLLDAADKALIGKAGAQANRRRLSDLGKAVIIGSNFPFTAGEFDTLTGRYKMEDYSKRDSGPMFSNTMPGSNETSNERRER